MLTEEEKQLIAELGFSSLPEDRQRHNLEVYYETLGLRLSAALEEELTDEQLAEFEDLHDSGATDEVIQAWLQKAVPNYEEIVVSEEEALRQDLKEPERDES